MTTTHEPLYIDIETYSRIDIKKNSAYKYAADEEFEILMAAWALGDGPVKVAIGQEEIAQIPGLWDLTEKVAHNAAFERICFSQLAREADPHGMMGQHDYLSPEPWTDTMALAAEAGYPRGLEQLASALGTELKDTAGTALIHFFCKPNRQGKRNMPEDHPEKWAQFVEYCRQDVVALRDVHKALPDWPTEAEREAYMVDQYINDTGIPVDLDMAREAEKAAYANKGPDEAEFSRLTGVDNPNSNPKVMAWFRENFVDVPNLQAKTVEDLLKLPTVDEDAFDGYLLGLTDDKPEGITPTVRRVLELRQELALVAAKKYTAAIARTSEDGRLRGAFAFFGAHTGRWAGRGVQLQNLPSATMGGKDDSDEQIERAVAEAALDVKLGLGASPHDLKALVRAMFVGPFTVVDYAAIEARVVSWLAGEQWALDAFAAGRDIYVETAERMGDGMTRKDGKVAVLALGYNGGINSLRVMGAEGSDAKLKFLVRQWREANEYIVNLWREMDEAFKQGDCAVGQHLYIVKDGGDRYLTLPSGRAIGYHNLKARWKQTDYGRRRVVSFADPAKWPARMDTYGGKLVENVTQAVARDILSEAVVRLHKAGKEVVGHVHDEILTLGASPTSVQEITEIMVQQPTWAEGLPLSAEGFTCARYRKG